MDGFVQQTQKNKGFVLLSSLLLCSIILYCKIRHNKRSTRIGSDQCKKIKTKITTTPEVQKQREQEPRQTHHPHPQPLNNNSNHVKSFIPDYQGHLPEKTFSLIQFYKGSSPQLSQQTIISFLIDSDPSLRLLLILISQLTIILSLLPIRILMVCVTHAQTILKNPSFIFSSIEHPLAS